MKPKIFIEGENYIYQKSEVTIKKVYSLFVLLTDGRKVAKTSLEELIPQD